MAGSDWRKLKKSLEDQGFTCEMRKTGHWLIRNPAGRIITTIPGTPSDHRSIKNSVAALKRAGYDPNGK